MLLSAFVYAQPCTVNYVEPSFQLQTTNLGCNPNSGTIEVINPHDGVAPYTYRLVELNITNSTGVFTGLPAGTYRVELRDACGTVRTRQASLIPYQFSFDFTITKVDGTCDEGVVNITTNPAVGNYTYGILINGQDTVWNTVVPFTISLGKSVTVIVKDACGNMQTKPWTVPQGFFPYISALQYRLLCDKVDIFPVFHGFNAPQVCLYTYPQNVLVECKQAPSGVYTGGFQTNFFNQPYGQEYYVIVEDACYRDSMFFPDMTSFGGIQLDPYDWDCTTFKMHVDGPAPPASFFTENPTIYGSPDSICLFRQSDNSLVGCKPTNDHLNWINPRTGVAWESGAVWDNLPYGCYYAYIFDPCDDTTYRIDSCVSYPFGFTSALAGHCSINQTAVQASFDPGTKGPYNVKIIYPDNSVAVDRTTTTPYTYILYNTWPEAGTITVIASDACGNADTSSIHQPQIYPQRNISVRGGCPGIYGISGGGDIIFNGNETAYNNASVVIIKRDGVDTLINRSYLNHNAATQDYEFHFTNLPTGVYVIESTVGCYSLKVYDTIEIRPYAYPVQVAPHIVQCGNNPYVFRDSITNGLPPFTYEITATQPHLQALLTGPQTTDIFHIPPGTSLDSVTIKVLDACGNSNTKTFPVQHIGICGPLTTQGGIQTDRINDKLITVYPNPSNSHFTISFSQKKKTNYRIEMVNATGVRIYEKLFYNVDKKDVPVDEQLVPGLYIIRIVDLINNKTAIFKQIVH